MCHSQPILVRYLRASFCPAIFAAAAFIAAPLPRARAGTDPADRVAAENRLTAGSWKITFGKGWSIIRIFRKDGTFWTPNRPDESGHWTLSNNTIVQTYGDDRDDNLTLPLNDGGMTGTARDGETMSAVHDDAVPAVTPAPELNAQQKAAIADVLASGRWRITSPDWSHVFTFAKDGTFAATKKGGGYSRGQWTLDNSVIILAFTDGHKDFMFLPLDPKGTAYADKSGVPATATLPAPEAADNTTMTAASAPAPAPQAVQPKIPATPADLLLSGPWKLSTKTRSDIRVFMKDGTFKNLNEPDVQGKWMMTKDFVILIFPGGHKDALYLPLNPRGTDGLADNGDTLTATLENTAAGNGNTAASDSAAAPQPVPASVAPAPDPQSAAPVAQDPAAATGLLVSGPWKISGTGDGNPSRIRTFDKAGTFSTAGHEDEYGWWKIVNNIVILTFADTHKESLKLPLDPKGTSGLDKDGSPISAVLQSPAPSGK